MTRSFAGDSPVSETDAALPRFVRETLGCGCPDEILARTVIDLSDGGESGLDVGGRLLVRVLPADDLDRLIDAFPLTVERLRSERDRRGFRRLRLVVSHSAREVLREIFEGMLGAMAVADEEVYVHVLSPGELPAALQPPIPRRPS